MGLAMAVTEEPHALASPFPKADGSAAPITRPWCFPRGLVDRRWNATAAEDNDVASKGAIGGFGGGNCPTARSVMSRTSKRSGLTDEGCAPRLSAELNAEV